MDILLKVIFYGVDIEGESGSKAYKQQDKGNAYYRRRVGSNYPFSEDVLLCFFLLTHFKWRI